MKKHDKYDDLLIRNYKYDAFTYVNINPSIRKITNTSESINIVLLVKTVGNDTLSNATTFSTDLTLPEVGEAPKKFSEDFEKYGKGVLEYEGEVKLVYDKTGDRPSGSERMLFENDLEVVLLGQDAVKTADQVKEDTKNIEKKNKSFPVWAIAVIVVASVFVLVIIIVVVIICVKKSGRVYGSD